MCRISSFFNYGVLKKSQPSIFIAESPFPHSYSPHVISNSSQFILHCQKYADERGNPDHFHQNFSHGRVPNNFQDGLRKFPNQHDKY